MTTYYEQMQKLVEEYRAKGGKALYQVDKDGKNLEIKKPARDSKGRFIKGV